MDLFPTAAAMGAFSLLKKYALSAQPTAIFYQGKPLSTALLFILPAWPLSAVAAAKGRLRMRHCQRILKAEKVPEATQMDAKLYILFSLQKKSSNC